MFWVTGDTHGDWIRRLKMNSFPEQKDMTKDDYVCVAGDFGIWNNSREENYRLDWLQERNFTTLFVEGNHSNYDILDNIPVKMWNGGKAHFIRPNVIHLMRGQVYNVDGKKIFTFGGARSHDISDGILEADDPRIKEWIGDQYKMFRINHVSWWKREMPDEKEMNEGIGNLESNSYNVDFIITHCAPSSTQSILSHGLYKPDKLTGYLEDIKLKVNYEKWIFGHYHIDSAATNNDICLFEQIVRLF